MKRVDSRVLTLRQPWADLIMAGVKDVENRTWPVPSTLPQWGGCMHCDERIPPRSDGNGWARRNCKGTNPNFPLGPFPFRLWIHSAGQVTDPLDAPSAWQALKDYLGLRPIATIANTYARRGFLLGHVTVTRCHHAHDCRERVPIYSHLGGAPEEGEAYCSPWAEPDVWHWTLADPVPLDQPVPLKGRQGLWRLPEGVA